MANRKEERTVEQSEAVELEKQGYKRVGSAPNNMVRMVRERDYPEANHVDPEPPQLDPGQVKQQQ